MILKLLGSRLGTRTGKVILGILCLLSLCLGISISGRELHGAGGSRKFLNSQLATQDKPQDELPPVFDLVSKIYQAV
jgi:hypothetical protein